MQDLCPENQFSGKGSICILKDDFQQPPDNRYDADGLVFSIPIFEKSASGLFHTTMDRFGLRRGRAI